MDAILKSRCSHAGLVLAAVIILLGVVFRGYWRDEFWALYFSAPELTLSEAVETRMVRDVHPPLYFVLLHYWRALGESALIARLFNLVILVAGAWAIFRLGAPRRSETLLFLLLCAGSYWVIFYTIELRMYLLQFVLCAMSVLVVRNALEPNAPILRHALLYALIGAAASFTHFFGALWVAVAGAWTGLAFLAARRPSGFLAWALASLMAIAPTLVWIVAVRPDSNPGAGFSEAALAKDFLFGANQYLRGLIVKTFGSNLPAAILFFVTCLALFRRRVAADYVLALSFLSVTVIAFAIHLSVMPLIKERAFIVIMPAAIFLLVRAIGVAAEDGVRPRLRAAIPIAAALSPLLFLGEYSKNREQFEDVRALLDNPACAGAPILVFNRHSEQAPDFHGFVTETVLRGAAHGADPLLIDAADASPDAARAAWASACPVKAVALALPKGDGEVHAAARAGLGAAGLDVSALEERAIARGRQLVFLAPGEGGS